VIYIKSILAGICALALSTVIVLVVVSFVSALVFFRGHISGGSIAFSLDVRSPFFWIGLLAFGAGFYWKFHRLSN
jgi:hypothetical protein